jgi:hypothetical protein
MSVRTRAKVTSVAQHAGGVSVVTLTPQHDADVPAESRLRKDRASGAPITLEIDNQSVISQLKDGALVDIELSVVSAP